MATDNHNRLADGPAAPPWCVPGAQPSWDSLTDDGTGVLTWIRDVGAGVWIAADDTIDEGGQWVRSPSVIRLDEPPIDGLDAAAARRLAADLLNAADLLDG